MNETTTLEAEVMPPQPQSQALARRQESGAVGRAMTLDELHQNLEFVRSVMRKEMKQGQDYGKIPGCGDKPSLLQPGAQKLLMVFNLTESVRKEELRDFPGFHREYAFTICVKAPNGKEWDGVGTCSTLEAKYRYRKAERKCPKCGHAVIIAENAKFLKPGQVAGWLCWKKKGGCGATFAQKDPLIIGQDGGRTENPDPAECWNTVRKMAFKRALVSAAINATNTSELWTQDIEDNGRDPEPPPESLQNAPQATVAPTRPVDTPPAVKAPASPAPATPKQAPVPTEESRAKMIAALKAGPGEPNREIVTEYFLKCENPSQLMPGEELKDLPLRFVPATIGQMNALSEMISRFASGDRAAAAFPPHAMSVDFPDKTPAKQTVEAASRPLPVTDINHPALGNPGAHDPEWWRHIIISLPRKGMRRDDYLAHPDTIGALFDMRHGQDEESQAARQRLWGLTEWEPKPREFKGTVYQPSAADLKCHEALQAFKAWFAANHPEEKL